MVRQSPVGATIYDNAPRWSSMGSDPQGLTPSLTPSLRGFEGGGRRRVAQLGQQGGLAALGQLVVALLDVAEAADLQRQRRKGDGGGVGGGRKALGDLVEQLLVVGDHLPLQAPLARVAEQIPGAAAQALAPG